MTMMTRLLVIVGEPDVDAAKTCPDCGFDSLLGFPLTAISLNGVGPWGTYEACSRCHEIGQD